VKRSFSPADSADSRRYFCFAKIPLCLKKIFVHFVFRCELCATSLRERSEVLSPADSADVRRMRMKPFVFVDFRRCYFCSAKISLCTCDLKTLCALRVSLCTLCSSLRLPNLRNRGIESKRDPHTKKATQKIE
jgi:hypothetical protein